MPDLFLRWLAFCQRHKQDTLLRNYFLVIENSLECTKILSTHHSTNPLADFYSIEFLLHSEQDATWVEEETLDAHSDWVRDVAWAPNIGLPISTIASCSLVSFCIKMKLFGSEKFFSN